MSEARVSGHRRPTIRDVARLADVSHQTVSRYLRGDTSINQPMQQRIAWAMGELDYRPSLTAQAMRSQRTGRLALLLPPGDAWSVFDLLAGASQMAEEAGYLLETLTLGGPRAAWPDRARALADCGLFDGIVSLTPLALATGQHTRLLVSPGYDEQMRGIGDLADAARVFDIMEHLHQLGHRHFLHVAGDESYPSAQQRTAAYLEAVDKLGAVSHGVAWCSEWSWHRARQSFLALPADSPVTAVIAANDTLAAGVVRGALSRGLTIPRDLSVTGWDDQDIAGAMVPSLTTVHIDSEILGRRAITDLLAALGVAAPPIDQESVMSIIWRESTGPAPAHG